MRNNKWALFFVLLFILFTILLTAALQVPAMPYIAEHFNLDSSLAGIITLCYYAAAICFAPIMGKLSDLFGRKNIILFGSGLFIISEILAAISPSFTFLLATRFMEGISYAAIYPASIALITDIFDEKNKGKAFGILAMVSFVGAASGGVIAGLLIKYLDWAFIYWTSGLLATLGFVILIAFLPKSERRKVENLDYKGSIALLFTIISLVSTPTLISQIGITSIYTISTIALFILSLTVLIVAENHAKEPVIDFKVLKLKSVYLPSLTIILNTFGTISLLLALTFYISGREGWGPVETGMVVTINYVFGGIASVIAGFLLAKIKAPYLVFIAGLFLISGSIWYGNITTDSSYVYIVTSFAIIGTGVGLINPSLLSIVTSEIPPQLKGVGTGMYTVFTLMGVSFGSTVGLALYSVIGKNSDSTVPLVQATYALKGISKVSIGAGIVICLLALILILISKKQKAVVPKESKLLL